MSRECAICRADLSADNPTACCAECRLTARNGSFETEVWLTVIGFPGWEISDRGRIRGAGNHRVLTPDRSHRYPRVWLNGMRCYVHHLQAETWLGPRPFGMQVLHADDQPANAGIANISYGTPADNAADRRRNHRKEHR